MSASYVLMLTAFYVDNGKSLPLWKELPTIAYWLLPGAEFRSSCALSENTNAVNACRR